VDEMLQAALHVPADRQEEFLCQQCGGDPELLEEVLRPDTESGWISSTSVLAVPSQRRQLS
jgi:hypothetical protein